MTSTSMKANICQKKSNTLPYVDICKFFFATCILMLHTSILAFLPGYGYIKACVFRLAVPYFFVCSGYFFGKKIYSNINNHFDSIKICKSYIKRMLEKLIVFELINIVILTINRYINEGLSLSSIIVTTIQEILFYPKGALWYIQALVIASIIIFPFMMRGKERILIFISLLLYGIGLLGNRYFFLIVDTPISSIVEKYNSIFITTRNGLFIGVPLVLLGVLIAKHMDKFLSMNFKKITIATIVAYLIYFIEILWTNSKIGMDDNSMYISFLWLIPLLFVLTAIPKQCPIQQTKTMRELSTSIYLLHSPILSLATLLGVSNKLLMFIFCVCIIILLCTVIYKKRPNSLHKILT